MQSSRHPLLVFDLDGTLVDTAPDLIAILNHLLEGEGYAPLPESQARPFIGHGAKVLLERGISANGGKATPERIEALYGAFLVRYANNIAVHSRPYPGLLAALDRFEAAGWQFAVCTNKLERLSRLLLAELALADRFQTICGADTFDYRKPDPRHLRETVRLAGGRAETAVMVGDSSTDIHAAQAAGIPVIAVDFGYTEKPVSTFDPDRVISSYDDLWAAVATLPDRPGPDRGAGA